MCVSKGQKHGAVLEISIALTLHRSTVGKTVKRGKVHRGIREQNRKMHRRFEKIDIFWKDLIRQSIYEFNYTKIAPTLDMLLQKLKERSSGTEYEFPYKRTTLYHLVKKLGFQF